MRVLITGGYGFVGTQLLRTISLEPEVTVLDNLMGYAGELPRSVLPPNHHFVFGDIRDKLLIGELVRSHDIIIHLAGIVGYPACRINPKLAYEVNVDGTKNITDALTKTQKFIFISSSSVYGHQTIDIVDESDPINPLTEYADHKAIGETLTKESAAKYIILRPATAFGKSDRLRLDLLPNTLIYDALINKKIEVFEPKVVRPFIHVLDFARALCHIIEGKAEWNKTYNIGNPELVMTKIALINRIAELTEVEVVPMEGKDLDQRNYYLDISKFSNTGFAYSPETLELAFAQLSIDRNTFAGKYQEFSSPYMLKKYLEKD